MKYIKIKDQYIPVKISPVELEGCIKWKRDKETRIHRIHYFKTNGFMVVRRLCQSYDIDYTLIKHKKQWRTITLSIPAMNINLETESYSYRRAMLKLAFKLHCCYTRKIETDTREYQCSVQV